MPIIVESVSILSPCHVDSIANLTLEIKPLRIHNECSGLYHFHPMNKTTDPTPIQQTIGRPVVMQMTGPDALAFLNNQTLTDLSKHRNRTVYTGICNPQGRLIYSLFIQLGEDVIQLAVDASISDNFLQYVNMRRFRMDFAIKMSDHVLVFDSAAAHPCVSQNIRFDNAGPPSTKPTEFWRFMFRLGLPWITADTAEDFIPQHLNLERQGIIDFDKGCYPGQEIVARLHFLGKVKKEMRLITHQSPNELTVNELLSLAEMAGLESLCSPAIHGDNGWSCQGVFKI